MADPVETAAPAFDAAAFKGMIKDAIGEMAAALPAPAPAPRPQPAPQARPSDPILDAVGPSLAPYFAANQLEAQSASDAAVFYATTPQAAPHAKYLEEQFDKFKGEGRPVRRADLWLHYKGANFAQFYEQETKEREEAARRAELASTVGSGAARTVGLDPAKPFNDMSGDELDGYLADKAF